MNTYAVVSLIQS